MRMLVLAIFCLTTFAAKAGDCESEIKATDTEKQLAAKLKCMREGTAPGGRPKQAASKPSVAGSRIQDIGGVSIEMKSCSRAGGDISCDIIISASDEETRFFQRTSKAVDQNGVILKWLGYQDAGKKLERGDITRSYRTGVKNKATVFYKAGDAPVTSTLNAVEIKFGRETYMFSNIAVK